MKIYLNNDSGGSRGVGAPVPYFSAKLRPEGLKKKIGHHYPPLSQGPDPALKELKTFKLHKNTIW